MKVLQKILVIVFFIVLIAAVGLGINYVYSNNNTEKYTFKESGYAITLGSKKEISSPDVYSFNKDVDYNYKKLNDTISFESENGKVKVDNDTIIHYSNNSLLVLKDAVAIDLTKLDNTILYYYNIFKNTTIENQSGVLQIADVDNNIITFDNMLLRISDNKYLVVGNNVRMIIDNVITDFGNFAYIEYTDGDIAQVYNATEYYKIINGGAKIVIDDININLDTKVVYQKTTAKLTLSNLIIDYDGNVDIIPEEEKDLTLPEMKDPTVDLPVSSISQSSLYEEKSGEIVEEEEPEPPTFKVTGLNVTANSINTKIEIKDEDALITTGTHISIIENATYTTVYETDSEMGNQEIPISYTGLNPDTEYTLYAESTYKLDDISYTRNFVSKIFRTESIGITFEKVYASETTVNFKVTKESYSKVEEVKVGIYSEKGQLIDTQTVKFDTGNVKEAAFYDLDSNTTYILKLYDIVINGVLSEDGIVENISFKTLKEAPTIGKLGFQTDKKEGGFNLNVASIIDNDYGIVGYRYEVYDARISGENAEPVTVINSDNIGSVFVKVDGTKILRGTGYKYVLVVLFNDNEKVVEYSKSMNETMKLDGVQFPSVSWQGDFINWEQINGTIIVNDPSGAVISNNYKIVYYNSINTYKTEKVTAETSTGNIPIAINGLRANETYTFEVYADINLQDGNPNAEETYIGCIYVKTSEPVALRSSINELSSVGQGFKLQFQLNMNDLYKQNNQYTCINKQDCNTTGAIPYEAATLSELNFQLYQGTSTNGSLVASKKELYTAADAEGVYQSLIASKSFTPNTITITPEYLGIRDMSDLTARTYTLVVSGLYDYTSYKNEIPIEGTTSYTIQLANYAQKKCTNKDNAIRVQEILNKYANLYEGFKNDSNLDPNTVVGYRILADYSDADIGTAKKVRYYLHVYNPTTGEFETLADYKTAYFDENGELDYVSYPVSNGTSNLYDTDTLRRGNMYYWTFEVDIDSDNNGTIDKVYPTLYDEEWYCGSPKKIINKQKSSFTTYPSRIENSIVKIKYKYKDVDNALTSNTLSAYLNGSNARTSFYAISQSSSFQTAEFTGMTQGTYYQIKKEEKLNSTETGTSEVVTVGYNYKQIESLGLSYSLELTDNYLIVKLDDYEANKDIIDTLGAVTITISPTSQSVKDALGVKTITEASLSNGTYKINLFDISKYLGYELKVSVSAMYDSGIAGFDVYGDIAVEKSTIEGDSYYYYAQGNVLIQKPGVVSTIYNGSLNVSGKSISLKNKKTSATTNIGVTIDSSGVVYEDNNIIFKSLQTATLASINNKITFNTIQPGISVTNGVGRRSILPGLKFANITARIISADQDIKDSYIDAEGHEVACTDCVFLEVFTTDDNGGNVQELSVSPIALPLSTFDSTYKLEDLMPSTNYYVKFYTYMKNSSGNYERTYFHDIDDPDADQENGYKYAFKTNSAVTISDVDLRFEAESYINKNLILTYQLSSIAEYDGIEYELLVWNGRTYVNSGINIDNSTSLNYAMEVVVSTPPQIYPNVKWGKQYKVIIKPYGMYNNNGVQEKKYLSDGNSTDGYEFKLDVFKTPSIVISTPVKPEERLYFLVSTSDLDHIIVDDTINIEVRDEDNVLIYSKENVSTEFATVVNLEGDKYNLVEGKNYTLYVTTNYDFNNDNDPSNYQPKTLKKTLRYGNGVTIGNITATQVATSGNKFGIDLVFTQTYQLSDITTISYSIISEVNSEYILSDTKAFTVKANGNIYTYQISVPEDLVEEFETGEVYTISLNFYEYDQNTLVSKLVGQDDVRFVYGG